MGDTINYNFEKGSQNIQHLDNQTININIEKVENMNVSGGTPPMTGNAAKAEGEADNPMIQELMPIFNNVRAEVVAFIHDIDGQKPTAVTEKVNALLKAEKINRAGCKGDLWGVLNRYGLYKPSVQNWNSQVNA